MRKISQRFYQPPGLHFRRGEGGNLSLAAMFHLCSHVGMERMDKNRVAEAILSAPGWARVGITAPKDHLRIEAAYELARVIVDDVSSGPDAPEPDQLGLSL